MTATRDDTALLWDDDCHLSLSELCLACQITAEQAFALVEEGVIEPQGAEPTGWRFQLVSVRRVRRAYRLTRDLGINLAGAALAVELLEEIEQLRAHLRRLERGDF
jgi:chaperone modulatory protein CbpM